jgi:hypothetical protein
MTVQVTIERCFKNAGYRYKVLHNGSTLVEGTANPEYDACRALLARGITGFVETYRLGTSYPCMRLDIEEGARKAIIENATEGPRLANWRPFPAVAGALKQGLKASGVPISLFAAA